MSEVIIPKFSSQYIVNHAGPHSIEEINKHFGRYIYEIALSLGMTEIAIEAIDLYHKNNMYLALKHGNLEVAKHHIKYVKSGELSVEEYLKCLIPCVIKVYGDNVHAIKEEMEEAIETIGIDNSLLDQINFHSHEIVLELLKIKKTKKVEEIIEMIEELFGKDKPIIDKSHLIINAVKSSRWDITEKIDRSTPIELSNLDMDILDDLIEMGFNIDIEKSFNNINYNQTKSAKRIKTFFEKFPEYSDFFFRSLNGEGGGRKSPMFSLNLITHLLIITTIIHCIKIRVLFRCGSHFKINFSPNSF